MAFGSLEVTSSEILVALGRLWTCLVPKGDPVNRGCRNMPLQERPVGSILGSSLE